MEGEREVKASAWVMGPLMVPPRKKGILGEGACLEGRSGVEFWKG